MMKSPVFWIVVLVIIAVVAYLAKQAMALYNYCWAIATEKTKIISINVKNIKIEMFIRFGNRSNTDVKIISYNLAVFLNGIEVSKVFSKEKQALKANDVSDIQLMIEANIDQLFKSDKSKLLQISKDIVLDKSKVVFRILGSANVGVFGISASDIPIDISMSLKEMMAPSTEPTIPCKKK